MIVSANKNSNNSVNPINGILRITKDYRKRMIIAPSFHKHKIGWVFNLVILQLIENLLAFSVVQIQCKYKAKFTCIKAFVAKLYLGQ
jgi:hypothetical protein